MTIAAISKSFFRNPLRNSILIVVSCIVAAVVISFFALKIPMTLSIGIGVIVVGVDIGLIAAVKLYLNKWTYAEKVSRKLSDLGAEKTDKKLSDLAGAKEKTHLIVYGDSLTRARIYPELVSIAYDRGDLEEIDDLFRDVLEFLSNISAEEGEFLICHYQKILLSFKNDPKKLKEIGKIIVNYYIQRAQGLRDTCRAGLWYIGAVDFAVKSKQEDEEVKKLAKLAIVYFQELEKRKGATLFDKKAAILISKMAGMLEETEEMRKAEHIDPDLIPNELQDSNSPYGSYVPWLLV